jgi:hypothetical protein
MVSDGSNEWDKSYVLRLSLGFLLGTSAMLTPVTLERTHSLKMHRSPVVRNIFRKSSYPIHYQKGSGLHSAGNEEDRKRKMLHHYSCVLYLLLLKKKKQKHGTEI